MGQDWGGRRKANPEDAPKITRKQVEKYAESIGAKISRDGRGMWFAESVDGTWYTLGLTNYLALKNMQSDWYWKRINKEL